jgi:hypothetical protein
MGDRLGVAESLLALAGAAVTAEPADAARLAGAADALLAAVGAVPTPRQQADLDRVGRAAAEGAARAEGAALVENSAVELACALAERLGAERRPTAART